MKLSEFEPEYRVMAFAAAHSRALTELLIEKGIVTKCEIIAKMAEEEGVTVEKLKELFNEAVGD